MTRENLLPDPLPPRCVDCPYRVTIRDACHCVGTMFGYCMEQVRMSRHIPRPAT